MADVSFTVELTSIMPTREIFYIPNWIVDRTTYWGGKVAGAGWESPYIWEFGSIRGAGFNDVPDTGYIKVLEFEGYVNGEWSGKPTGNIWSGNVRTVIDGEYIVFNVAVAIIKTPIWPWVVGGVGLLALITLIAKRKKK